MRNTLLNMLATLMWVLTACAEVAPVQNFDLEKVGQTFLKVLLNVLQISSFANLTSLMSLIDDRQVVHRWICQ